MSISDRTREVLATLIPLAEDDRHKAAQAADLAIHRIIGSQPRRDQFKQTTISEYPGWFSVTVAVLLIVILAAASTVSVFRVYTSAYEGHMITIPDEQQARIVGWATFVMAEVTVVICTLAALILFKTKRMQRVIYGVAFVAALIAVIGNANITRPVFAWTLDSAWQILETLAPPLFVMATALVGERLVADAIRQRHSDETAYKAALITWQEAIDATRQHALWRTKYRNAIRDYLRTINGKGRGREDRIAFMQTMTAEDWTAAVQREEAADLWYIEAEVVPDFQSPPTPDSSWSLPSADYHPRPLLPTPANSKELQE